MTSQLRDHALFGADAAVLDETRRPGINLAVWQRRLPPALYRLGTEIAAMRRDHIGLYVGPGDATTAIAEALNEAAWTCPTRLAPLATDIARLAQLFLRLCNASRAHVDLAVLDGDGCRLFHVDHVGLRLLTTYAGPGTEWLGNDNVCRAALGQGSNAAIVRDTKHIHRLEAGWVGLFRGEADPANAGNGIVHRSAPLQQSGRRRLLLRIDLPGRHLPPDEDPSEVVP
jgi:hypothetical protein